MTLGSWGSRMLLPASLRLLVLLPASLRPQTLKLTSLTS